MIRFLSRLVYLIEPAFDSSSSGSFAVEFDHKLDAVTHRSPTHCLSIRRCEFRAAIQIAQP
jgi:hypothetical protein